GRSVAVTVTATANRTATDTDVSGWVTVGARLRVPYLLTLRPLQLTTSPDPSDGHSEVFVLAPADLVTPPVVTVTAPDGKRTDVTATLDHGRWYRAPVTGARPGGYTVQARATTTGGQALWGTGTFEVVANTAGDGGWQPIGPNGQSGLIATSPAAPDQLVLAQDSKVGLWRTTDRGRQWRQLDRLPVAGGMGTVVVDPRDADRMWYAVNGRAEAGSPLALDPTYEGKVLLTTDGGSTWQTLPFPNTHVNALVSDGHTLLAVTPDGVVGSDDGGARWTTHAVTLPTDVTDAALAGGDLYVSAPEGVWVVRNATGDDLAPAEQVFTKPDWAGPVGVAADAELVVTATADGVVRGSRDGGRTWSVLYQGRAGGYATAVRMVDGTVYVAGTRQDLVGRDHGATWSVQPKPAPGPVDDDFGTLGDSTLVSAGSGGLYTTADGGGHYRRIGVQGGSVPALAVGTRQDGTAELVAGTDTGIDKTPLPTGSQVDPEWGSNGEEGTIGTTISQIAASPADPHVLWKVRTDAFAGFWVSRSDDGGATWSDLTNRSETPTALLVDPADPREVVIGYTHLDGSGIYITRDGGATWRKYALGHEVDAIAGDPAAAGWLWLGSPDGLYRSDDNGGVHFTKVADGAVSAITLDRRKPQRIVVGGAALRVSTDGGRTFRTADAGPLAMRVSSLLVSPRDPDVLYAGTAEYRASGLLVGGRGVLRSADGGRTWRNVSSGLQNTAVLSLAVAPDGGWLYAGTEQGGVHRLRLTDR
ncbi:MAG: WD40/YVTN/BNR-like repeat-containing protein, partial [Actinoallomurus sp.]